MLLTGDEFLEDIFLWVRKDTCYVLGRTRVPTHLKRKVRCVRSLSSSFVHFWSCKKRPALAWLHESARRQWYSISLTSIEWISTTISHLFFPVDEGGDGPSHQKANGDRRAAPRSAPVIWQSTRLAADSAVPSNILSPLPFAQPPLLPSYLSSRNGPNHLVCVGMRSLEYSCHRWTRTSCPNLVESVVWSGRHKMPISLPLSEYGTCGTALLVREGRDSVSQRLFKTARPGAFSGEILTCACNLNHLMVHLWILKLAQVGLFSTVDATTCRVRGAITSGGGDVEGREGATVWGRWERMVVFMLDPVRALPSAAMVGEW
jgi:hypothetical protein